MIKKLCTISSILLLIITIKEYIPILPSVMENQIMVVQAADITDFIIENGKLIKYNGTGSYVEIPENVTIIGRNAFSDCSSLVQVKIPKGVTVIESCAFQNCNNLSDIEIPVSITTIESLAFSGCENLKEIEIPAEVNEIVYNAFEVCTSLTKINVSEDNETYCSQDGVLYSKSMNELICYPAGKQDDIFEIPLETTMIGCGAFEFSKLKEIVFSSRVQKIEHSAFFECDNLKSIEIPENITIIDLQTFYGCDNLENVKISSKVEKISTSAFNRCKSLKEIEIPFGVTEIGESVFYGCNSLMKLQIPNNVVVIGKTILKNAPNAIIYCESDSYAQKYAMENGYSYKIIENATIAITDSLSNNEIETIETDDSGHLKGVAYHTQEEIKQYIQMNGSLVEDPLIYLKEPEVTAPFSIGTLSEQTLNSAIDMLNQVRYIAGLSYNVSLKDNYNTYAQAASLVNYVNNRLDHFPSQPKEMRDSLYELGRIGASSSNLARSFAKTECVGSMILHSWMADDDSTNIDRVGHRRWILNPCMGATGFGAVNGNNGTYLAVYVMDESGRSTADYSVWPAQNMPLEYFDKEYPWSFSTGDEEDIDKINVILTRKKDNQTWSFSHIKSNGEFYVNNVNYGLKGCIIFKPDDIIIQDGDSYTVQITGLKQGMVSYEVNFFSIDSTLKQMKNKVILEKNGEKFVTDRHGASVTGYFTYDGKSYYAKKDGTLLCNDFTPDRRRYASEDGSFIIGKFSANGKTYITDEQGLLYDYETPLEYHGKYYYVKEDGSLAYNEFVDNGWCYATKDYYLQTGEFMVDGKKYIANENGCLYKKNGKFQYNGNYYYASEDGSLVKDEFIAGLWYATDNYTLLTNGAKVIGNEKYFFNKRANIKGSYDLMKGRSIVKYNIKANDKYKVFNSKNITIPKKIIVKEGTSFRLCNADIGIGCSVSGSVSGNWLFNNKFKINGDTDFKINIKMNGKIKTYKVKVKVKK